MTDRLIPLAVGLVIVALALALMAGLHERHYKNRRWQMLEARLNVLERIIGGDHD